MKRPSPNLTDIEMSNSEYYELPLKNKKSKLMKLKLLTLLLAIFISNAIIGQSLNEYKYIIIPSKFDFLKSENQHQLNSLTKFLFEKEGFKTIYDNLERPADLSNNPCLGLTADVFDDSGMFTTKLSIELTNCKNQKILQSEIGKSKEKDYKKGFQEALRNAFKSVTAQNYSYSGKDNSISVNNAIEDAKNAVTEAAGNAVEATQEVEEKVEEVEITETSEDESTDKIGITEIEETSIEMPKETSSQIDVLEGNILYAQANPLGYQLVDSTPKVVYVLLKSSQDNIYFLRYKKGIVYKENNQWIVEYYDLDKLVKEVLAIKF